MSFCEKPKGCGARIEWYKTPAGKSIPIDPDPVPNGNIYFEKGLAVYGDPGSKPKMYVAHFVTCPNASNFRKPKAKAFICERRGCEIKTEHRHCFECGATDHLAEDCPDA